MIKLPQDSTSNNRSLIGSYIQESLQTFWFYYPPTVRTISIVNSHNNFSASIYFPYHLIISQMHRRNSSEVRMTNTAGPWVSAHTYFHPIVISAVATKPLTESPVWYPWLGQLSNANGPLCCVYGSESFLSTHNNPLQMAQEIVTTYFGTRFYRSPVQAIFTTEELKLFKDPEYIHEALESGELNFTSKHIEPVPTKTLLNTHIRVHT
jgi:hypothetical protein